ncbi:hypothetical protein, partial [Arthrobacter sp. Hiyo1]|uniref:hypothetical protein n=1 Tax=Arthrobacter sp. Hiyo1 TaxID=1588020 RepID=UPI000A9F58F7
APALDSPVEARQREREALMPVMMAAPRGTVPFGHHRDHLLVFIAELLKVPSSEKLKLRRLTHMQH